MRKLLGLVILALALLGASAAPVLAGSIGPTP